MIGDGPDRIQRTPMKESIERTYLESTKTSNALRNILISRCAGSKDIKYKQFIMHFGYLFNISHYKKDLDKDLIGKCNRWFNTPHSKASNKNVQGGLKLYDEYVLELFRLKMLTYD